ncbi:MAG: sulfotransferase [Desulfamplus sp.]|nr:sulfotransferase [Desulfamplus sp.]
MKEEHILIRKCQDYINKGRAVIKAMTTDLSHLRYFVVFIGNPRSGTTIVRSLLDAHPNIVLGNEVNALEHLFCGEHIKCVMGRILNQSSRFALNPFWNGYAYHVPMASTGSSNVCMVIGDKKASRTTRLFMENISLLYLLQKRIPIPVRFIHCVRNPFDVITTKTLRNGNSLEWNIQQYFRLEQTSADVLRSLKPEQFHRVYLEQLIENPSYVLQHLIEFLSLTADDDYLLACKSIVYDKPNHSRFAHPWSQENISEVEHLTLGYEHLSYYLDQGKLFFAKTNF